MTTIVAFKVMNDDEQITVLAADQRSSVNGSILSNAINKIIETDNAYIGVSVSQTSLHALKSIVQTADFYFDSVGLVYESMTYIMSKLVENHHLLSKSDDDYMYQALPFNCVIACKLTGRIFHVCSGREVSELNVTSSGSGSEYALGALTMVPLSNIDNLEDYLNRLFCVVSEYDTNTSEKFTYATITIGDNNAQD